MVSQPGFFVGGAFSIFFFLIWLACIGAGVIAFVLFVKLALRAITALDLYNHSKNLEIRERETIRKE